MASAALALFRVNVIVEEIYSCCFYLALVVAPRSVSAVNNFANTGCVCSVVFILNAHFTKKEFPSYCLEIEFGEYMAECSFLARFVLVVRTPVMAGYV